MPGAQAAAAPGTKKAPQGSLDLMELSLDHLWRKRIGVEPTSDLSA